MNFIHEKHNRNSLDKDMKVEKKGCRKYKFSVVYCASGLSNPMKYSIVSNIYPKVA